jgi:hypothetical protein
VSIRLGTTICPAMKSTNSSSFCSRISAVFCDSTRSSIGMTASSTRDIASLCTCSRYEWLDFSGAGSARVCAAVGVQG